ncbi:ribokinase [Nocardioides terrae]|uniref:Ribokinase n=1 Tax=Nocardioides terrae TaxID=574651 RepID=A0A1I1KBH1_9ACTN|nr:PfkB family carbohydrate kinase [Nocardioides terrae]SFC58284.1 ribokinase [Nocardioides terrae]
MTEGTGDAVEVVVLGSANLDVFAAVPVIPPAGQTVLADGPEQRPGGKGLNQAVASARAGAATRLLAAVGHDDAAAILLAAAADAGVDTALVRRVDTTSGTAWITVQPDGENAIVVLGAANRTLTSIEPAERDAIAASRVLVTQLETPLSAVREAAAVARAAGTTVLLNASPLTSLDADDREAVLGLADILVVNQHEAAQLAGAGGDRAGTTEIARALASSVPTVVVTLGGDGALLADRTGLRQVPGVPAEVVDTTGAGDTFAGVLAAALAAGDDIDAAAQSAVIAGALAVERSGAVTSIPSRDQIERRRAQLAEGAAR